MQNASPVCGGRVFHGTHVIIKERSSCSWWRRTRGTSWINDLLRMSCGKGKLWLLKTLAVSCVNLMLKLKTFVFQEYCHHPKAFWGCRWIGKPWSGQKTVCVSVFSPSISNCDLFFLLFFIQLHPATNSVIARKLQWSTSGMATCLRTTSLNRYTRNTYTWTYFFKVKHTHFFKQAFVSCTCCSMYSSTFSFNYTINI